MARCLHCGEDGLSAAFHDWFCFACGKRSKGVDVQNNENGDHSQTEELVEGLDRRTDVRTPAAGLPAATPSGLITAARPAAETSTPELEGEKIAAVKVKDSTTVPAEHGEPASEAPGAVPNGEVPPAPPSEAPQGA